MPRRKPIPPQTVQKRRRLRRNNQALANWDRILGGSQDIHTQTIDHTDLIRDDPHIQKQHIAGNDSVSNNPFTSLAETQSISGPIGNYMSSQIPSPPTSSPPGASNYDLCLNEPNVPVNILQCKTAKHSVKDSYPSSSCAIASSSINIPSTTSPNIPPFLPVNSQAAYGDEIVEHPGIYVTDEDCDISPENNRNKSQSNQTHTDPKQGFVELEEDSVSATSEPLSPVISFTNHTSTLQKLQLYTGDFMNSNFMIGIQLLYGKVGFTITQYEVLSSIFKHLSTDSHLPSHSTLRSKIWPYMFSNLFAKSFLKTMPTKLNITDISEHSKTLPNSTPFIQKQGKDLLLILPSEWAARDIAHIPFLSSVFPSQTDNVSERGIEESDIVRCAETLYCSDRTLWVREGESHTISNIGDIISFNCVHVPTFKNLPISNYDWDVSLSTKEGLIYPEEAQCEVQGVIDAFWSPAGTNSSIKDHCFPKVSKLSLSTRNVLKFLSGNVSTPSTAHETALYYNGFTIFPGDVCTVLISYRHKSVLGLGSDSRSCNLLAVHVSRFWRTKLGRSYNFIAWFVDDGANSPEIFDITKTSESPSLISSGKRKSNETYMKPTGILCTGKRYFIYRLVLYADDFNPKSLLFPRGSVGGVYMLPMGLPVKLRRGMSSVHPISLTPSGVSTNQVLDSVIDDLKKGMLDGFDAVDAFGNNVRIFLHLVGFIGDYPAAADVIDVMKHSANSPCTLCSFRRRRLNTSTDFAFTTSVHCRHSSFRRGIFRSIAVRSSPHSVEEEKWMGMSNGSETEIYEKGRWPQLKLAAELFNNRRNEPDYVLNNEGKPIILDNFDPYCANVTAPDHCLTGLINGVLQIVFLQIQDEELKRKLDIVICAALREVAITGQTSVYNFKSKKTNTLSMSTLYAVILTLPTLLKTLKIELPVSNMARILQKLVALIFWWPTNTTDDKEVVSLVHGNRANQYYDRLLLFCKKFINSVSTFCSSHPENKSLIDRPNIHRLLELVTQDIPLYGHALIISEMMFEAMHQPLKRSLSKDTNKNSHMTAIRHALYKDWISRISDLWSLHNDSTLLKKCENLLHHLQAMDSDTNLKGHVTNGLCRLFCGDAYTNILKNINVRESSEDHLTSSDYEEGGEYREKLKELSSTVLSALNGLFGNNLISTYSSRYPLIFEEQKWVGFVTDNSSRKPRFRVNNKAMLYDLQRKTIESYKVLFLEKGENISIMEKAILQRKSGSRTLRTKSQHILRVCDSFEVTARIGTLDDVIVHSQKNGLGEKGYFFVHNLFEGRLGSLWAGVSRFKKRLGNLYELEPAGPNGFQLLQLTLSVRRILVVHACDVRSNCIVDVSSREIVHENTLLSGDYFYILRRSDGYPPRSA